MPVVPAFDPVVEAHVAPLPEADPRPFGEPGAALAAAGQRLSDQMSGFEQKYLEARRAVVGSDTAISNANALSDLGDKWSKVENRQQAISGFDADAAKLKSSAVDNISDPFVQAYVSSRFGEAYELKRYDVDRTSFVRESAKSVGDLDLQMNDLSHAYANAGNDLERGRILDSAHSAILSREASGYITGDQAATRLIGFRSRADAADATRDIDANPAATLERLNDNANYPNLDELTRGRLISRAESKAQRGDAAWRGDLRQRYDDNLASIEATGQPASSLLPDDLKSAFPGEADEMMRRLDLAQGVYQANGATVLTSGDQDKALLDKWQPRGVGFSDQASARGMIAQALTAKWKAIDTDPAAYVMSASPEVAGQFKDAQSDPAKMRGAFASLDAAYDKLGLPQEERPLLSGDTAQRFSASIMQNPSQAPAVLKTIEQQAGSYWPRMFGDLVSRGKLPASYQAVATLDNDRDGAQLARWLGDLPSGKSAGDLLGPKLEGQLRADVRSNPDVQSFLSSLSRSGSSNAQVASVADAVNSLAYAKAFYDHDPRAAQNAASAFTSKFEFMPDGGARVPRASFDAVSANARSMLDGLTAAKVGVPKIYGLTAMPKPEEYIDQLRAAPSWITSPNADALWLMDGQGRIVRDKGGKPLSVPFNAPAPPQKGFFANVVDTLGGSELP